MEAVDGGPSGLSAGELATVHSSLTPLMPRTAESQAFTASSEVRELTWRLKMGVLVV